jgi:hypothetical protein
MVEQFAAQGAVVLNDEQAIAVSLHPIRCLQRLSAGGLSVPRSVLTNKGNKAENGKGVEGGVGPAGLRGRRFRDCARGDRRRNSRPRGPPGQRSASRTSAVHLRDAVHQLARGSEGWAVVGGRMSREGI